MILHRRRRPKGKSVSKGQREIDSNLVIELTRELVRFPSVNPPGNEAEVASFLAERMREKLHMRGEIASDIVVVQGDAKETLRLYGMPHSVARVRAAMFNAAIHWRPIELD